MANRKKKRKKKERKKERERERERENRLKVKTYKNFLAAREYRAIFNEVLFFLLLLLMLLAPLFSFSDGEGYFVFNR